MEEKIISLFYWNAFIFLSLFFTQPPTLNAHLEAGSTWEAETTISFLSVQVELAGEPVACGPAVLSIAMLEVLVEKALKVLDKYNKTLGKAKH